MMPKENKNNIDRKTNKPNPKNAEATQMMELLSKAPLRIYVG